MATVKTDDIKKALNADGINLDTSSLALIWQFKDWYNGQTQSNFDQIVCVQQDENSQSVVESGGRVTYNGRRKNRYNVHIQACKQWASLFFNENTELEIKDEARKESAEAKAALAYLEKHYADYGLWPFLEQEKAEVFGIGAVGIVTEYSADYGIIHKAYAADSILPITVIAGKIREAAFISTLTVEDKEYTIVNVHLENIDKEIASNGLTAPVYKRTGRSTYTIRNYAFETATVSGQDFGAARPVNVEALGYVAKYDSPARMFIIDKHFNRRIEGLCEAFSPPVYYDSYDMVREIDDLYDIKQVDTQASRRVIFIEKAALVFDKFGKAAIPQFLLGIVVSLKAFAGFGGEEKPRPIQEFAPEPRCDKYSAELKEALNRFSLAVGLGSEALKYERNGVATATQVISENQEKFVHLKKHYSVVAPEYAALNRAILACANEFENGAYDLTLEIGYFIQDGVVVDDETRRIQALQEVAAGVMSLEYYVENYRGLSGEELTAEIARLKQAGSAGIQEEIDGMLARLYGKPAPKDDEA